MNVTKEQMKTNSVIEQRNGCLRPQESDWTPSSCGLALPLSRSVVRRPDSDVTVGQCVVSERNLAYAVLIRHKALSDGDVKVCLLPQQLYVLSQGRTTVSDGGLGHYSPTAVRHSFTETVSQLTTLLFVFSSLPHQLGVATRSVADRAGEVTANKHALESRLLSSVQCLDRLGRRGDMRDDSAEILF